MTTVEVIINSKVYQIGCDEKEKDYIKLVISDLNEKILKLKKSSPAFFNSLSDEKLFLYQLILMYSELRDLKKKKNIKTVKKETQIFSDREQQSLNKVINNIKQSVKKIDYLINFNK